MTGNGGGEVVDIFTTHGVGGDDTVPCSSRLQSRTGYDSRVVRCKSNVSVPLRPDVVIPSGTWW